MAIRPCIAALCALAATLNVHANPVVPSAPSAINNPASFVPPTRYRSVFADTPTGVEQDSVDWKKANADVGQFRNGFADILQWEAAQEALKNPRVAPAAPAAPVHKH